MGNILTRLKAEQLIPGANQDMVVHQTALPLINSLLVQASFVFRQITTATKAIVEVVAQNPARRLETVKVLAERFAGLV